MFMISYTSFFFYSFPHL